MIKLKAINTKKVLFTLSGLAMITILVLFGRSYNAQAAVKEGEVFGDWIVRCEKDDKKKSTCFLMQELVSKDPKDETKKERVAIFRIGYFPGSKDLKFLQILPFGTSVQVGTSVIIGKDKLVAAGKFTTCQPFGCIAVADLKKEDLDAILGATETFLGFMSVEGKQINLKLSTNGLKDGIAALK